MNNMLLKVNVFLIFCVIIATPVVSFIFPAKIYLGDMTTKLSIYFVIVGILLWLAEVIIYKKNIELPKNCLEWLILLTSVGIISTIYGLNIIDYTIIDSGKLKSLIQFIPVFKGLESEFGLKIIHILRLFKTIVLNILFTFGVSLWIYNVAYSNSRRLIKIYAKGIVVIILTIFLYAIYETAFLMGIGWGREFLQFVNPLLYPVGQNYGWWPPLLWPKQMRLVFPEPSNIGLFIGAVLPLAFIALLAEGKRLHQVLGGVVIAAYSYFVFMSQARTAYVMLVFAVFLFMSLLLVKRNVVKQNVAVVSIATCICVAVGFMGYYSVQKYNAVSTMAKKQVQMKNTTKKATPKVDAVKKDVGKKIVNKAINDNFLSVISSNQRSNTARYGVIKAELAMGMDHWLLGVGRENTRYFFEKYLPKENLKSGEVRMWIRKMHESHWKTSYPCLNEYTRRFAEEGIGGLMLFVAPFFYIIWHLGKLIIATTDYRWKEYAIVFMGLVICTVSWMGNTANAFYLPYILLGLGFAMCFGKRDDNKDLDECK